MPAEPAPLELLLVRHAVARERDRARWPDDERRPLSPGGARRMRRAAKGLARLVAPPELLFTSTLVRARQTAAILRESASWPAPRTLAGLAPGRDPRELLARLAALEAARVAIVGHEPGLGRLLAHCLYGPASPARMELRKGAAACVRCCGCCRRACCGGWAAERRA